jgi:hypothetical protein
VGPDTVRRRVSVGIVLLDGPGPRVTQHILACLRTCLKPGDMAPIAQPDYQHWSILVTTEIHMGHAVSFGLRYFPFESTLSQSESDDHKMTLRASCELLHER